MTRPEQARKDKTQNLQDFKRAITEASFFRLDKIKVKFTDRCNLRCLKCNHWLPNRENRPDRLSPLSLDEWLDVADQLADLHVKKVAVTGGEPTLDPALPPFMARLTARKVRCSLTTNGTLLAGGVARKLIEAGLSQARFSVDGVSPEVHDASVGVPGSFERLKAGLEELQTLARTENRKLTVNLNTVVSGLNLDSLEDIVNWAAERNVVRILMMGLDKDHLTDDRRQRLDLAEDELERYYRETLPRLMEIGRARGVEVVPLNCHVAPDGSIIHFLDDRDHSIPCNFAWFSAAIYPSGDVQVCCNSRHRRLRFGNVREGSIKDMIHGPTGNRVREVCQAPDFIVHDCRVCPQYADRYTAALQLDLVDR